MIDKQSFIEAVEAMQLVDEYQEAKNKLYRRYKVDGYLIEPDNNEIILRLLNLFFKDCTEVNAINTFCIDNHYGVGKNNQIYEDTNGQQITLSSPSDLYDYLVININSEGGDSNRGLRIQD